MGGQCHRPSSKARFSFKNGLFPFTNTPFVLQKVALLLQQRPFVFQKIALLFHKSDLLLRKRPLPGPKSALRADLSTLRGPQGNLPQGCSRTPEVCTAGAHLRVVALGASARAGGGGVAIGSFVTTRPGPLGVGAHGVSRCKSAPKDPASKKAHQHINSSTYQSVMASTRRHNIPLNSTSPAP